MQSIVLWKWPTPKSRGRSSAGVATRCCHPATDFLRQLASWASFVLVFVHALTGHVGGLSGVPAGPCMAGQCDYDRPVQPPLHQQQQQQQHHDSLTVQHDQPISERQMSGSDCKYPCNKNCSTQTKETCRFGVSVIKDGCDCCLMCARQQGDMCSNRDKCDENKGLYCDFKLDGQQRGICRSRNGKHCNAFGKTYKDGEEFKPNCSQLCTCQDGRYACSSLCPQEFRPPSSTHCRDAQLVAISNRCCREWVCPHSHSLLGPDDNFSNESPAATERNTCKIETTHWSSCSQSCGVGVSLRMTGDKDCQPIKERRLCIIRPCPESGIRPENRTQAGDKETCRTTWKDPEKRAIKWGNCESVNKYQLKYCSVNCKRQQCCGPSNARIMEVGFNCQGQNEIQKEKVMWIKACDCQPLQNCPFR